MRLTHIHAQNFLSFADFQLDDLDPRLTTIVGPNSAGKSNLMRAVNLAVRVLEWTNASQPKVDEFAGEYLGAVKFGVEPQRFRVSVGIQLDTAGEREMLKTWLRAALLSTYSRGHQERVQSADPHLMSAVDERSVQMLASGSVVVALESLPALRFSVGYEFDIEGQTFCYVVRANGNQGGIACGGLAENLRLTVGGEDESRLLTDDDTGGLASNPADLDFHPGRLLPREDEFIELSVQPIHNWQQTETAHEFMRVFRSGANDRNYMLDLVLTRVLSQIVIVGEARGAARRRYSSRELALPVASTHVEDTPLELLRLKLGDVDQQQRFHDAQQLFSQLTDGTFDLSLRVAPSPPEDEHTDYFQIEVQVTDEPVVSPLRFAGAGRWEALILSTALTAGGAVTILDEPAINLHPTLQRRLLQAIRAGSSQTLLITHSPFLVPAENQKSIETIIRLTRDDASTYAHRARFDQHPHLTAEKASKLRQLIVRSSDARALLFARAALLVEGPTEVGALEVWLPRLAGDLGLPSPSDFNLVVISVDGDGSFGHYVSFLDVFAIPWVILCDGKTLAPDDRKSLRKQLASAHTKGLPAKPTDLAATKAAWEDNRVFTLARTFSDEIEQYMRQANPEAWNTVSTLTDNKIRRGRAFAEIAPPPAEVQEFYAKALKHLCMEDISRSQKT